MNKTFGTIPLASRMPESPIFGSKQAEDEIELINRQSSTKAWQSPTGEIFHLNIPPTVYPPREDTDILAKALLRLGPGKKRKCLEIGCGSGVLSALAHRQGWEVTACDINPFAVACTRGLAKENKMQMNVFEGGPSPKADGEISQWTGDSKFDLIFWNLPYLKLDEDKIDQTLGPLEEAGLIDTDENGLLNRTLKIISDGLLSDNGLALFVVSSQNEFSNYRFESYSFGLATREMTRIKFQDDEELRVVAVWNPYSTGQKIPLESVDSTNSFLLNSNLPEGSSVYSKNQKSGHGRRNRQWIDYQESFACSWVLFNSIPNLSPGLIQILAGLSVIDTIKCITQKEEDILLKWPNDILISYDSKWRKVSGILIESKSSGGNNLIIAGIGINLSGEYKNNFEIPVGFLKHYSDRISFDKILTVLNAAISSNFEKIDVLPDIKFSNIENRINSEIKKTFHKFSAVFYRNKQVEFSRIFEDGSIEISDRNSETFKVDDSESINWKN